MVELLEAAGFGDEVKVALVQYGIFPHYYQHNGYWLLLQCTHMEFLANTF